MIMANKRVRRLVLVIYRVGVRKIEEVEISKITAKPGHRVLRSRDNILAIAKAKKEKTYLRDPLKKIQMNIITNANGEIKWLDLWDGHHRILADIVNHAKIVRDLDMHEVEILVNGVLNINGKKTKPDYIVNIGGVDFTKASQWTPSIDGGPYYKYRPILGKVDILADGSNSNQAIGSITSLGDIFLKLQESKPKVVIFNIDQYKGKENMINLFSRLSKKFKDFDQVVIYSDAPSKRSKLESSLKLAHEQFPKLNLYTGSDQYWATIKHYVQDMDGHYEVLQRRLKQIYSTLGNVDEVPLFTK